MRFIMMDDEAADLIEAAAEMSHAALQARAKRVDPDGIISRSVNMSRIKTADVLTQLRMPPLGGFADLSPGDQRLFSDTVELFSKVKTDEDREKLFKIVQNFAIRRAAAHRSSEAVPNAVPGGLRQSDMAPSSKVRPNR